MGRGSLTRGTLADQLKRWQAQQGRNNVAARLDAAATAQPLTRIIHHPGVNHCIGPGSPLRRPEYEDATGQRIPLR